MATGTAWRRNPAIILCHAAAEAGLLKFAPSLSAAIVTLRRILKAFEKGTLKKRLTMQR
jgi:hypothetical protein